MSVATRDRQRWDTRGYRWIASAEIVGPNLRVGFEDGDRVDVELARLLPRNASVSRPGKLTFTSHDVSIPSSDGVIDVSWVSIRLATDPAFDAHWRAMAAEEARIIGELVAKFRRERGLSRAELARQADVSEKQLGAIEDGQARAGFESLERILAPLGRTLDDLEAEPLRESETSGAASGTPSGATRP